MSILNEFFDHIYLLYIDQDELNQIIPKLKKQRIEVDFFKGVIGSQQPEKYNLYVKNRGEKDKILNHGSFGHLHSFINILKDAKKNNYKKILIFEPDIYFSINFDKKCEKYLKMDFMMLYFGASQNKFYTEETWPTIDSGNKDELNRGFYYADRTLGTFALAIDQLLIDDCLKELYRFNAPTDVSLVNVQKNHKKKCIVTYPNLICCNIAKSKTSSVKNQILFGKQLRWDLSYDFEDCIIFQTEPDSWYQLSMGINSFYNDFRIRFEKSVFPTIDSKELKVVSNDNRLLLFFLAKESKTVLNLSRIFVSSFSINRVEKRAVKHRINIQLLRKLRDLESSSYYFYHLY